MLIRRGSTTLWQYAFTTGDDTTPEYDVTVDLRAGDSLDFVIHRTVVNNFGYSPTAYFNPTIVLGADTTPPVLSNVAASNITSTSAMVSWASNEASNSQVEYGPTASYGTTTALDAPLVTSHSVALSGLVANTDYFYRVRSVDAAGNLATASGTFRTASGGPTTYQAAADFSLVQGTRGWSYLDSTGAALTADATNGGGKGRSRICCWGPGWGHPGSTRDAVRRWTVPQDGSAQITGTARDLDAGGGDGVVVSIRHGATVIWQATITNGNTTGVAFDLTRAMHQGETLDFVINRRGNNGYDSTDFNPTIALSPQSGL